MASDLNELIKATAQNMVDNAISAAFEEFLLDKTAGRGVVQGAIVKDTSPEESSPEPILSTNLSKL